MKAIKLSKEYLAVYIPKSAERKLEISRGDILNWKVEGNNLVISKIKEE